MSSDFAHNLEKYAELIVQVGLNLQPGQRLMIGVPVYGMCGVPIELAPLVRLVTREAYRAGAKLVDVMWNDDQLRLIRFQDAPRDSFNEYPRWRAEAVTSESKAGEAMLILLAEDPDLLTGQDPALISAVNKAYFEHMMTFTELRFKKAMNWLVVTAPVGSWPDKVFPDLPPEDRKSQFWDTIFEICRVKHTDPILAWKDHVNDLAARRDYLNDKHYSALRLIAPGTDLMVALPRKHIWRSARMTSQNGISFVGNIPTEEIFTIPNKDKTEGIVSSTRPLNYGGSIIDDFSLTFSNGRVVEAEARVGEDSLNKLFKMDEGARRLGEVALVPHSSPISQSGLLFYNTLIDENASSHLALGRGLHVNIEGGETMSDDEFAAEGGNQSKVHVDFMVGSGEMDVDALTEDGAIEPIMCGGEWVFET